LVQDAIGINQNTLLTNRGRWGLILNKEDSNMYTPLSTSYSLILALTVLRDLGAISIEEKSKHITVFIKDRGKSSLLMKYLHSEVIDYELDEEPYENDIRISNSYFRFLPPKEFYYCIGLHPEFLQPNTNSKEADKHIAELLRWFNSVKYDNDNRYVIKVSINIPDDAKEIKSLLTYFLNKSSLKLKSFEGVGYTKYAT